MTRFRLILAALVLFQTADTYAQEPADGKGSMPISTLGKSMNGISGLMFDCEDGSAVGFPCSEINLLSFMTLAELAGDIDPAKLRLNDVWGWNDEELGREYAIVGLSLGTVFVDVTDPVEPIYLGILPMPVTARSSVWRDIKVYNDHAFIVADGADRHGMQVFNLRRLRNGPAGTFSVEALYDEFSSAHNIAINTASGYAYVVGARGSGETCGGGLHMIDIRNPVEPVFAGCFSDPATGNRGTGYSHDAQCVNYQGPDTDYQGREICFGLNENGVSIADVTDKANPVAISVGRYPDFGYVHQGWLTEDHRFLLVDDEGDERQLNRNTHTKIFDVEDLDAPIMAATYEHATGSIDHNLYIRGNLGYQANYTSGLRILDLRDPLSPIEVGYFDTTPVDSSVTFSGAWSVYPFLASGNILVSSINEGLFVLSANVDGFEVPEQTAVSSVFPNPFNASTTFSIALVDPEVATISVYDVLGRHVETLHDGDLAGGRVHRFSLDAGRLPSGTYVIRVEAQSFESTRTVTLLK